MLESALAAQRGFLEVYGEPLEQIFNMAVYFVPIDEDENDTSGFGSQAVFALTDLFNLYRTVLLRSPDALPIVPPSSNTTCVETGRAVVPKAVRRARIIYSVTAFVLRAMKSVQVLIEMQAQRLHGPEYALRVCVRVEVVKLAMKMVLRSCMPFSFYMDEDALEEVEPPKSARRALPGMEPPQTPQTMNAPAYVGSRSGKSLPAMGAVRLLSRLDCTPGSLALMCGEAIFHCRPLVHLMVLMRRGRKSWVAWFTALVLDYVSLTMMAPQLRPKAGSRAGALEVAEMRRRRNLLWWSLARSPMFEKILKRPCEVLDTILSKIPFINMFRIMELYLALQPYYFSSSAS